MEPNNIDNQFKEKLESRAIMPSESAWDRLDAMLTVADSTNSEKAKQKPKRNFSWLYIAASFLGFLLVATVFFSQTEELIDVEKAPIVHETIVKPAEGQTQTTEIAPQAEGAIAKAESKEYRSKNKSINQNPIHQNQTVESHKNQIAENPTVINQDPEQKEINQKSNYANVDELLAAVKKNKKDKLFQNGSTIKVNSGDLLSQVDGELELSFRQKVIKSVSRNYQEVKVALSTRNQE